MNGARHTFSALLVLGCLGTFSLSTAAQEPALPYATNAEEMTVLEWERNKELMHPGIPLAIAGLEQGENGFRERTPGLEHTDWSVALVDADDLYRSRLAMYAEGATFRQAPRVVGSATLPRPTSKSVKRAQPRMDESAITSRGVSWVLATVLVALLATLFVVTRGRRATAE